MLSLILLPIHIDMICVFRFKPMYQHLIIELVKSQLLISHIKAIMIKAGSVHNNAAERQVLIGPENLDKIPIKIFRLGDRRFQPNSPWA